MFSEWLLFISSAIMVRLLTVDIVVVRSASRWSIIHQQCSHKGGKRREKGGGADRETDRQTGRQTNKLDWTIIKQGQPCTA